MFYQPSATCCLLHAVSSIFLGHFLAFIRNLKSVMTGIGLLLGSHMEESWSHGEVLAMEDTVKERGVFFPFLFERFSCFVISGRGIGNWESESLYIRCHIINRQYNIGTLDNNGKPILEPSFLVIP